MNRPADGEREVVGYSLLTARILHLTHAVPSSLAYLTFHLRQEFNLVATDHGQYENPLLCTAYLYI